MQAHYYLDIRVIGDEGITIKAVRNQVFAVIHGAFASLKHDYALALVASDKLNAQLEKLAKSRHNEPKFDFDIFRIFANDEQVLQALIDAIQGHFSIRDYTVFSPPIAIPTAKIKGWKSYRRFRIPTKKAERRHLSDDNEPLRSRRLKQAKNMPFLQVKSRRTGQGYTVIVDIQDSPDAGHGTPDGYGLARQSQPFALPVF